MVNIAVMGYGTVGSGVVEVINTNGKRINQRIGEELNIKYVLDLRDFPGDPVQEKIIHDFETIVNDDEIKIVVEVMGGIEPAYTFVKRCLLAGKSVATSNKALVAKHGAELLSIAREKNINFLFEASVGGGIPIIRPLNSSLTADEIEEITGILNGTTNYMMTKMFYEGADYDTVLKEAQANGYSVRDIVIIASMIERETDGSDRATISSVIYNRWQNTGAETAGYLGVDATLVYALGRTITQDDYTADTPYNTYTNQGLPPGPISNPGMASINAAMEPESTNYYYYALGNDGTHSFFRTLSEQQNFIAQQRAES